ncbi:MAG TPA: phospholipase [Thermoanaerobaculia bacterium]|nr:phospholipase [Thermoanaerobaculia bacterium]
MKTISELPAIVRDAYQRDTLGVAFLSDLFTDGVPVKGDDTLLIVVLDPPTHATAVRARFTRDASGRGGGGNGNGHPFKPVAQFEGGEHTAIGNSVTLSFPGTGALPAATAPLTLANNLQLTYGQIVALAGDFYGVPANPISSGTTFAQQQQFFLAAFNTLNNDPTTQAAQILGVMQTEINAVRQAMLNGEQSSSAYEVLGDTLSAQWNKITGGGSFVTPWYPLGRYLQLAAVNFDHFSQDAVTSYTAGHAAALAQAVVASQQSGAAQIAALQMAYAMNAFADHFLSDLFSSGHMRTPRRQLYDSVTPSDLGSLLSREMHDEDSLFGLIVTSVNGGVTWRAYGDKRYADTVDQGNAGLVDDAVQTSASEVFQAFSSGQAIPPPNFAALQMMANLAGVQQYGASLTTNTSPMFAPSGTTVAVRNTLNNLNDYSWTTFWIGSKTYLALRTSYDPALPTGDMPVPVSGPTISSWQQQTASPPNWVGSNAVRYAVSFTNFGFWESDPGPWSPWVTIQNEAFPSLAGVPTDPTGIAAGRNVWRQFTNSNPTFVGAINDNTTTTFTDIKN